MKLESAASQFLFSGRDGLRRKQGRLPIILAAQFAHHVPQGVDGAEDEFGVVVGAPPRPVGCLRHAIAHARHLRGRSRGSAAG